MGHCSIQGLTGLEASFLRLRTNAEPAQNYFIISVLSCVYAYLIFDISNLSSCSANQTSEPFILGDTSPAQEFRWSRTSLELGRRTDEPAPNRPVLRCSAPLGTWFGGSVRGSLVVECCCYEPTSLYNLSIPAKRPIVQVVLRCCVARFFAVLCLVRRFYRSQVLRFLESAAVPRTSAIMFGAHSQLL